MSESKMHHLGAKPSAGRRPPSGGGDGTLSRLRLLHGYYVQVRSMWGSACSRRYSTRRHIEPESTLGQKGSLRLRLNTSMPCWLPREGEPFELRTRELIDLTDEQVFLCFVHHCPNCGADEDEFQPLGLTDGLALPVVAETLLSEMPVAPRGERLWLPAQGRRMLIFSHSRREAARLGPLLTRSHEIQLARAILK